MTQNHAALTLPSVDYGGSIGTKTDVTFELGIGEAGKANVEENIRTGYLVNNQLSEVLGFVLNALDSSAPLRQGVHLDVGGGEHVWTLDWQSPGDTQKPGGGHYQWGSSPNPPDGPNAHTATGADPYAQQAVFMNALRQTTIDSRKPAVFSVGEYADSGILDPVEVVVESPGTVYPNDQPSRFDGQVTLVETATLDDAIDAALKPER